MIATEKSRAYNLGFSLGSDIFFSLLITRADHSRLGRNRLVVGQLLEEDFVRLGIRYIAIMDNIDTKDGLSDFLPVQDWFNEMHAKNTSKKVRAVFQNKGMSGKPLTTVIPYGYKKNEADSTHWLIDEEAAEVVRRIFRLCVEGYGPKSSEEQKKELAKKRRELSKSEKRIAELDVLFQRIYEDNVSGKLSDERFSIMSASYEAEQKTLKEALIQLKAETEMQDDKTANVSAFVEKVKHYTETKELTPAIVNEFIDYIMVSKKQVIDGKTVYPIDIYYNGVGIINAPSAEEYEAMFQERLKQKRSKEEKTA